MLEVKMFWRLVLPAGRTGFAVFRDCVFWPYGAYACAQDFLVYCHRLVQKALNVNALASIPTSSTSAGSAPSALAESSTPALIMGAPLTSAGGTSRLNTLPLSTAEKLADIVDQNKAKSSHFSGAEVEADPEALQENCDILLQSSEYEKTLEKLTLREVKLENINTLLMIVECHIFLGNFQQASGTFEEAAGLAISSKDVEKLIERSQHYRQSDMFFRSLNYIWCACSVYQTRGSPGGILECLHNMGELLVKVVNKYGLWENPNCERFASFHLNQLLSLGELKELRKRDNSGPLEVIRLHRYGAIASCFLLLKKYSQSLRYFGECIGLLSESTEPSKINFSIVGNFVAGVALSYNETDEKLQSIAKRVDGTRKDVTKFAETSEKDAALKANLLRYLEYCAIDVQNSRRTIASHDFNISTNAFQMIAETLLFIHRESSARNGISSAFMFLRIAFI